MGVDLVRSLMENYAETTGLIGGGPFRRYLWTDAFAVCNFLGLYRDCGEKRYLGLADNLVQQVHHVLGRHRSDDTRHGWISGLSEEEGERHPTSGGLRIGKALQERSPYDTLDEELEWERDGQYFHYLTKWMHALHRMSQETADCRYGRWAVELAIAAYERFLRPLFKGGPRILVWKMSIDLSRPLVPSSGQHDAVDGLVTCLELESTEELTIEQASKLSGVIDEAAALCLPRHWITGDPLGIGGLLDNACRLSQLVFVKHSPRKDLLHHLLLQAKASLDRFDHVSVLRESSDRRLAFRELGLAIGIHGLTRLSEFSSDDRLVSDISRDLPAYEQLARLIEFFWSEPANRVSRSWLDHREINAVMLAASLAPESYLQV